MARYIDIENAEYPYMSMSTWGLNSKDCKIFNEGVKATEDMLMAMPAADVVSRVVFDQFKWERDMAFKTLEEHGLSLGIIKEE